jgi:hypothetical protein
MSRPSCAFAGPTSERRKLHSDVRVILVASLRHASRHVGCVCTHNDTVSRPEAIALLFALNQRPLTVSHAWASLPSLSPHRDLGLRQHRRVPSTNTVQGRLPSVYVDSS